MPPKGGLSFQRTKICPERVQKAAPPEKSGPTWSGSSRKRDREPRMRRPPLLAVAVVFPALCRPCNHTALTLQGYLFSCMNQLAKALTRGFLAPCKGLVGLYNPAFRFVLRINAIRQNVVHSSASVDRHYPQGRPDVKSDKASCGRSFALWLAAAIQPPLQPQGIAGYSCTSWALLLTYPEQRPGQCPLTGGLSFQAVLSRTRANRWRQILWLPRVSLQKRG